MLIHSKKTEILYNDFEKTDINDNFNRCTNTIYDEEINDRLSYLKNQFEHYAHVKDPDLLMQLIDF